jgi:pimeloyl-ACP methyl ester carboxylesterase
MARVNVDGVGIEYEVTGHGQPVVLLHGFPDSGRLWRHQVPALATAGFQVIVPDLRGYGRSDKPAAVESYALPLLAADVLAVLADLNVARTHLVGHDWGAALAWGLASLAPGAVDHLAVLSVGHPATFRRTPQQREKSWYMLLFQFPGIAERWLTEDDWANFRNWARHPDTDQVIADMKETGSLTPGLNWYRANLPPESWVEPPLVLPPVQAPTMGIWSTNDIALTEAQMTDSVENVTGPWRYERLTGPGHWMQLDAPDQVNALLLDFLPGASRANGADNGRSSTGETTHNYVYPYDPE